MAQQNIADGEFWLNIRGKLNSMFTELYNHVTNTSNPHSVTKSQVGLSNVDNTSDTAKPVSTAQQTALNLKENSANKSISVTTDQASNTKFPSVKSVYDWATGLFATITNLNLKAPLASPALTGTPTAPTAAAGTNTTQIATTAHVFAERTNSATLTNKTLTSPTINTPTITNPVITGTMSVNSQDASCTARANLTLLNSRSNYGSPYATAQYRKQSGFIALKGLVAGGTSPGAVIGNLPAGYRPSEQRMMVTYTPSGSEARFDIMTNGDVVCSAGGNVGYTTIDCVFPL